MTTYRNFMNKLDEKVGKVITFFEETTIGRRMHALLVSILSAGGVLALIRYGITDPLLYMLCIGFGFLAITLNLQGSLVTSYRKLLDDSLKMYEESYAITKELFAILDELAKVESAENVAIIEKFIRERGGKIFSLKGGSQGVGRTVGDGSSAGVSDNETRGGETL